MDFCLSFFQAFSLYFFFVIFRVTFLFVCFPSYFSCCSLYLFISLFFPLRRSPYFFFNFPVNFLYLYLNFSCRSLYLTVSRFSLVSVAGFSSSRILFPLPHLSHSSSSFLSFFISFTLLGPYLFYVISLSLSSYFRLLFHPPEVFFSSSVSLALLSLLDLYKNYIDSPNLDNFR